MEPMSQSHVGLSAPNHGNSVQMWQSTVPNYVCSVGTRNIYANYRNKQAIVLGIIQITVGVLCIVFHSVAIANFAGFSVVGHGIWCGVIFIVTGSFGILSGTQKTQCPIVTSMVLSIISAVACVPLLSMCAVGISFDQHWYYYRRETAIAMNAVLICLSLAEAVCSIWLSVLCCAAVCCGARQVSQSPPVYYQHGPMIQPSSIVVQSPAISVPGQQGMVYIQDPRVHMMNPNQNTAVPIFGQGHVFQPISTTTMVPVGAVPHIQNQQNEVASAASPAVPEQPPTYERNNDVQTKK